MPARKVADVSQAEAHRLIDEILDRRRRHHCPDLHRASDDPLTLVRYVTIAHRVPAAVVEQDVLDALRVLEYARTHLPARAGEFDELEYMLLVAGQDVCPCMRAPGCCAGPVHLTLSDLAEVLEVSGQAVSYRVARHRAAGVGLRRSELADRKAGSCARAEVRWRRLNASPVRTAVEVLGKHQAYLPIDAADLLDIILSSDSDRPATISDPLSWQDLRLLRRVVEICNKAPAEPAQLPRLYQAALVQCEKLLASYQRRLDALTPYLRDGGMPTGEAEGLGRRRGTRYLQRSQSAPATAHLASGAGLNTVSRPRRWPWPQPR